MESQSFNTICASTVGNKIAASLYATALVVKDATMRADNNIPESLEQFETLNDYLAPSERKKITVIRKKKDKTNGLTFDEPEQVNPRKFVNLGIGAKFALTCLLKQFLKECLAFYEDSGRVFPNDPSFLVSQLTNYSVSKANAIAPLILNAPEMLGASRVVSETHKGFSSDLLPSVKIFFGGESNTSVVVKILNLFNDFIRLLGIHLGIQAYWGRNQIKIDTLMSTIQAISAMMPQYGAPIAIIRNIADEAAQLEKNRPKKPAGEKKPPGEKKAKSTTRKKAETVAQPESTVDDDLDAAADLDD